MTNKYLYILIIFFLTFCLVTPGLSVASNRAEELEIIKLTNDLRRRNNIFPVKENQDLNNAARAKATDMLEKQYFAHLGPDGRDMDYWIKGSKNDCVVAGENLAIGYSSAVEVMRAWENSSTHYQNLVDTMFTKIGVGMISGKYHNSLTNFFTQYFCLPNETKKNSVSPKKVLAEKIVNPKPTSSQQVLIQELESGENIEIKIAALLSSTTKKVEIIYRNQRIKLHNSEASPEKWTGEMLIQVNPGMKVDPAYDIIDL